MTPKEKAEELMQKFRMTHVLGILNTKGKLISPYKTNYAYSIVRKIRAKSCALIAVEELLKDTEEIDGMRVINNPYWMEVRNEIEKL